MYYVPRGGTRGGADQFQWDDVKSDKDRECYLGHSLMAPVGRWQKGKDLQWFNKDRDGGQQDMLNEIEAAKQAEKEALMTALGQKVPKAQSKQPVPQPKQTREDRESRKPSKSKNGPLLKAGLSLERTAALLRAEKTSKSKKKRKMKKEKKKKSKDKKKKKRKKHESSDSSSDSSEDSDSSSDEDLFRKQKRPTKESSSHQKRTKSSSHSEEERRITSRRPEQSRHQSHTRHETHESYRSHSYDKQQSTDVYEEDRRHRAKGKDYFVDGKQASHYGKRQSRYSSSDDEDIYSRSKGKGYVDDQKHLQVKGHSIDSGHHGPTRGRVNHRYHSASDSSDDDYTSRKTTRSPKRFENRERSRGKGQDSNFGHSPDRRAQKRNLSPGSDSTDEDDPRQHRTAKSYRHPGHSLDRHDQRSRSPKHTGRHDSHNRKYDRDEKDRKYSRSPIEDRDNRWRDDRHGSSSRSESRRESRGYYK